MCPPFSLAIWDSFLYFFPNVVYTERKGDRASGEAGASLLRRNLDRRETMKTTQPRNQTQTSSGNLWALLPIAVFIILFVGSGILSGDFYMIPTTLVFLIALFITLLQNKQLTFTKKLEICATGAGDSNIIIMCIIYLLAGGFSGVATAAGGVTSTVNLALSIIPAKFAVAGLFLMGCFISMAMGTSVGTIVALTPIAVDISQKTGYALPLTVAAVVCGAMFGDNLSFISDTTIAAVRTQGCEMRDKFKANFFVVLPAAIITLVLFCVLTQNGNYEMEEELPYNIVQVFPYLFVLIGALCGINVFAVLAGGIVASVLAGLYTGSMTLGQVFPAIGEGMTGMYEIVILAILASCISALVQHNGGFQWVLSFIHRKMSGYRGAQFGIILLVCLFDAATANNTVAIVLAGPMAKQISQEYDIAPKRSASLLDIFGSVSQGVLPYGAQLLSAARLAGITSMMILPHLYYTFFMAISAIVYVLFTGRAKRK